MTMEVAVLEPHLAGVSGDRRPASRALHTWGELPLGGMVNLGTGMPAAVAAVACEKDLLEHVTLIGEPGIIGGMPGRLVFGAAVDALRTAVRKYATEDAGP